MTEEQERETLQATISVIYLTYKVIVELEAILLAGNVFRDI